MTAEGPSHSPGTFTQILPRSVLDDPKSER